MQPTISQFPQSIAIWRISHLWSFVLAAVQSAGSCPRIIFKCHASMNSEQRVSFALQIWSLWKFWNSHIWKRMVSQHNKFVLMLLIFSSIGVQCRMAPTAIDSIIWMVQISFGNRHLKIGCNFFTSDSGDVFKIASTYTVPQCLLVTIGEASCLLYTLQWLLPYWNGLSLYGWPPTIP